MREKLRHFFRCHRTLEPKTNYQDQPIILTLQVKKLRLLEIKWHAWRHAVTQGMSSDQVTMLAMLSPKYSHSSMQSPYFSGFYTSHQIKLRAGSALWAIWFYTWRVSKRRIKYPLVSQSYELWPIAIKEVQQKGTIYPEPPTVSSEAFRR